ncbi:hypothetical protein WDH52_22245 [Streptomyces sp. TRM70308]|uniref:hypothetical protein n=1 Tax=Streptomyces sp. TRM70308 TaxID=3131932 RepID=UPI003CFF3828
MPEASPARRSPAPSGARSSRRPPREARGEPPERPRTSEGRAAPRPGEAVFDPERLRRRALFLRELSEAKALRDRVQPRRARAARMREQMRMRTFRW